jgi:hypothetical protein
VHGARARNCFAGRIGAQRNFHLGLSEYLPICDSQGCHLRVLKIISKIPLIHAPKSNTLGQWFPKFGARPLGGGAQEILKGGARGAKLFYSLKINENTSIICKI